MAENRTLTSWSTRTFCRGKQETGSRSHKSLHGGRRNSGGLQRDVESDGERAAEQRPPAAVVVHQQPGQEAPVRHQLEPRKRKPGDAKRLQREQREAQEAEEAARAKALLDEYQRQRFQSQRQAYEQGLARGEIGGIGSMFRRYPLRTLAACLAIAAIAAISLLPFVRIG